MIAFESDDSWIGNVAGLTGEPDDPYAGNHRESLTYLGVDAGLMTDLDSERDDPSFVYAGAYLADASEIDLMQVAGLSKNVSVSGSGLWSRGLNGEATVYESGLYSYLLSVTNEEDTTKEISGIVILDEIEGYVPTEEDADGRASSAPSMCPSCGGWVRIPWCTIPPHLTLICPPSGMRTWKIPTCGPPLLLKIWPM